MAPFNPDIPSVSPGNYENSSKPIANVEANLTTATALKGFANTAGLAIEASDKVVKQVITDQLYAASDKERSGEIQSLSNMKDRVLAGLGNALGLTPTPAEVPDGVSDGLDQVNGLQNAAGKISSTMYWARLTNITKDIRSQFPGYREYIDEQVSKITGHNPANAYMTSLIQDLNRAGKAAPGADSLGKKIDSMFLSEEIRTLPQAPAQFKKWQQTGDVNAAYEWQNDQLQWQSKLKRDNAFLTNSNLNKEDLAKKTTEIATTMGQKLSQDALDAMVITIPGSKDSVKLTEHVLKMQREGTKDEVLSGQIAGTLAAGATATMAELDRRLAVKIEGTNETMASRMGFENVKKLKEQVATGFAQNLDLIKNSDYGTAHASRLYNERYINDAITGLYKDMNTAEFTTQASISRRILGDTNNATLMNQFYGQKETKEYGSWLQKKTNQMLTQRSAQGTSLQSEGQLQTFNDALTEGKTKGGIGAPAWPNGTPKSPEEKRTDGATIGALVKQVNLITTPGVDDEGKKNIARAAYTKGNDNMLAQFALENRNPVTGKIESGQHSVFRTFASEAHTKEMYRLGQSEPKLWENYQNWVTHTWGRILFRNEILELNRLGNDGVITIGWNKERQQWSEPVINQAKAREYNDPAQMQLQLAKASDRIQKINGSLSNIKALAEASGDKEISSFLLQNFLDAGIDPRRMPVSMSGEMLKALIGGNKTPPEDKKTEGGSTPTPTKNNASTGSVEAPTALQFSAEPPVPAAFKNISKGSRPTSRQAPPESSILSIDYGPIERRDAKGNIIRIDPGAGVVTPE